MLEFRALELEHSDSPKIVSIPFTPENRFESIRPIRFAVTQKVGGSWGGGMAVYGVLPRKIWVPVIRQSVVWQIDADNQYNRIGRSDLGGNQIDSNTFAK